MILQSPSWCIEHQINVPIGESLLQGCVANLMPCLVAAGIKSQIPYCQAEQLW